MEADQKNRFLHRVLVVFAVAALFVALGALLTLGAPVLLLTLSAVLVALLLHDGCLFLEQRLHWSRLVALGVILLLFVALLVLGGWLIAPPIVDQVDQLVAGLPAVRQRMQAMLLQHPTLQQIVRAVPEPMRLLGDPATLMKHAGTLFGGVFGFIGDTFIVAFVGVYLAVNPGLYTDGIVKLFPKQRRPRMREVLDEVGESLRLWLRGKMFSMAVIAVASVTGLMLLGVPMALTLGILAGILDFIPYIGPIMAAVPAMAIAFMHEPALALQVAALFLAIQTLEGYLLLPLVEHRTVSMPPALTIMMQVLMGMAFGLAGVALATPLTVILCVGVAMLYVQDVLHDRVDLPAEQAGS